MKKTTRAVAWAWVALAIVLAIFELAASIGGKQLNVGLVILPWISGKLLLNRSSVGWWSIAVLSSLYLSVAIWGVTSGRSIPGHILGFAETNVELWNGFCIVFFGMSLIALLTDRPSQWHENQLES